MLSHPELIGRIAVGAVLGGLIGYQRDRHGKPVGLRTHAIVGVAAAGLMVVSSQFVYYQHYAAGLPVHVDSGRMASSAVMGIGFLAGGAILRTGITIQGLTTAAGLWLVTAIGLASGAGMWVEGITLTVLGLLALGVLGAVEGHHSVARQRITVVTADRSSLAAVREAILALGASVDALCEDSRKDRVRMVFDVQIAESVPLTKIVAAIEEVRAVEQVRVQTQKS